MNELDLIKKYAESLNTMDISRVAQYFAAEVKLVSQLHQRTIASEKAKAIELLSLTLSEVKKGGMKEKIYAEVGFCTKKMIDQVELFAKTQPSVLVPQISINQPCILISEIRKENIVSIIFLGIDNDLINEIFACGRKIPTPTDAERTDEYPGLQPLTEIEKKELEEIDEQTIRRHLTWFDSGHHEYLQVAKKDLIALNVWQDMSPCSYEDEEFAYLEEDMDATTFILAADDNEWILSFDNIYSENFPILEDRGNALENLSDDPRCHHCREEGEEFCDCPRLTCPICGDEAICGEEISIENFSCDHFLAGWDDSGVARSVLDFDIKIDSKFDHDRIYSTQNIEEAFGEFEPFYEIFEANTGAASSPEFWGKVAEMMPQIEDISFCHLGWEASGYFAEDPVKVTDACKRITKGLEKGFRVLAKIPQKK